MTSFASCPLYIVLTRLQCPDYVGIKLITLIFTFEIMKEVNLMGVRSLLSSNDFMWSCWLCLYHTWSLAWKANFSYLSSIILILGWIVYFRGPLSTLLLVFWAPMFEVVYKYKHDNVASKNYTLVYGNGNYICAQSHSIAPRVACACIKNSLWILETCFCIWLLTLKRY